MPPSASFKRCMPFMRIFLFIVLILAGPSTKVAGQADSVLLFAKKITLGISKNRVDSLFPFFINKHFKNEEFERSVTESATQYYLAYFGMNTGMSYVMKFLFDSTGLIYFNYLDPYRPRNSYALKDQERIDGILEAYNQKHNSKETFSTLLYSFTSRVNDLNKPFENFIFNATYKDKQKLIGYTKSICPEYRATSIMKIVDLETKKKFLSRQEKYAIKQIAFSDMNIHFRNGCIVSFEPLYMFIDMHERLAVIEN